MFRSRWLSALSLPESEKHPIPFEVYFSRLPTLETPSLILRPLRRDDAADLFSWCSDPEVTRYVLWTPHRTIRDSKEYIRYMRGLYRSGQPSSWGMVCRKDGRLIGTIGFMWVSEVNCSAEVGYSMARSYWNQGLMTEALQAVIRSAFSSLNLNRIEAQRDARNPASGRVMEKCGMRLEGTLRSRIINKGEAIDVMLYAVLRSDMTNLSGKTE